MIDKSIYENYTIDFSVDYDTNEKSYYLIFNKKREVYLSEDKTIPLVTEDMLSNFNLEFKLFIGTYKNHPCFVANTDKEDNFFNIFSIYEYNKDDFQICLRGVSIRDWYIQYQYCGRCGTKNQIQNNETVLICPECGQKHRPRISPAVIVAITKENQLLMAHHSYYDDFEYSLIAGFVEPGESVEEAVHREVFEEIGIKIKNLKYKTSQSFPFPDSLMLGFSAQYDSGKIKVDGKEILKAVWFDKEDVPQFDSDMSIAHWLIEDYFENH